MTTAELIGQAPLDDAAWHIKNDIVYGRFWKATDPVLVEVLQRVERRELTSEQLQEFLGRLLEAQPEMAGRIVSTHARWPEGVPIRCRLQPPSVLFRPMLPQDVVIRASLLGVEGAPTTERVYEVSPGDLAADENEPALSPSGLPPGRYEIEVELYVGVAVSKEWTDRRRYAIDRSAEVLAWKGVARTIEVGGKAADLLEPHDSEAASQAIVRSLQPQFFVDDRNRPWLVMFRYCCHIDEGREDWALAGIAEVSRDGGVAARGSFVYPMMPPGTNANFHRFYEVFPLEWTNDEPVDFDPDDADWQVHLAGNAEVAIRDLRRESYWSGKVEVPASWPMHGDLVTNEIRRWDRREGTGEE
jgi:hypothetical protein